MKNVPVVVISNRDDNHPEKYRVRNLLTGDITFTNRVILLHPAHVPNVDSVKNLEPERVVKCNWALTGTLATPEDVRKFSGKTAVQTASWGFDLPNGDTYYEGSDGPLKAIDFGESGTERYVWLGKKPK